MSDLIILLDMVVILQAQVVERKEIGSQIKFILTAS